MKTVQSPGHPLWGSTLLISFMFFLDLDLFLVTWWVIFLQASPHLIVSTICWEWFWFYYCHPFIEELRVPWTAKRSNQTILKKINPEYSLEGLMLKLQYFGPPDAKSADWLEENLMLEKTEGRREKEVTEDKMVGWHHWLNIHKLKQSLGDSEEQGNLVCGSPWGCKELDTT